MKLDQDKPFFHLSKWKTLAKPQICGGWGLKSICDFGEAVPAKSLWRGQFLLGMWHAVLKVKYLKKKSFDDWIRGYCNIKKYMSNILNCCLSSMHVMASLLAWKPSKGSKIWIGEDPIVRINHYYKLSKGLLVELNDIGLL